MSNKLTFLEVAKKEDKLRVNDISFNDNFLCLLTVRV